MSAEAQLIAQVRESLLADPAPITDQRIAQAVRDTGRVLGAGGMLAAVRGIRAELTGLGPLQPLLPETGLTDVWVNGHRQVWMEAGRGPQRLESPFASEEEVRALAVRLISAAGRRLDEASPAVDVQTASGMRVHAVIPPIATDGTLLSVRFRSRRTLGVEDLVRAGTVPREVLQVLLAAMAGGANLLVTGATGSGKTTVLNALLSACPEHERIVLIEDSAELRPEHPHAVGMQSRHANAEGAGEVSLAELVRQSLRMRPDRIVVGECRGAEVRELLTALNTGHLGAGTVHANAAAAVPARLAALGALGGMSPEATALQAGSALDAVVHLGRVGGRRVLREIALLRSQGTALRMVPAYTAADPRRPGAGSGGQGPGWPELLELADRAEATA